MQNTRFTEAHLAGDVATIDSMFAPEAKSSPSGTDAVSGVPSLHDFTASTSRPVSRSFARKPETSMGTRNSWLMRATTP